MSNLIWSSFAEGLIFLFMGILAPKISLESAAVMFNVADFFAPDRVVGESRDNPLWHLFDRLTDVSSRK
ncbi:hypothetical protein BK138_21285 [Paenibacillus rhizosphaerae]|uniref:Uncharacterized protein n=1 Tax=Paenibacillus rhizosphaerae TaxID=297318 RepID=A0A1R1ELG2_9BACL|nr:hypothetical protein BK138_21285 [Paenibacillus rhizosphaerae]